MKIYIVYDGKGEISEIFASQKDAISYVIEKRMRQFYSKSQLNKMGQEEIEQRALNFIEERTIISTIKRDRNEQVHKNHLRVYSLSH